MTTPAAEPPGKPKTGRTAAASWSLTALLAELTEKPYWALVLGAVVLGLAHLIIVPLRVVDWDWDHQAPRSPNSHNILLRPSPPPPPPPSPLVDLISAPSSLLADHSVCFSSHSPSLCPNPALQLSPLVDDVIMSTRSNPVDAARRIAAQFEYPREEVQRGVEEFIREMREGLSQNNTTLSQIPTYVTSVPDGTEKGLYLAVDLGGTNFRVCSVELLGNGTYNFNQSKITIPQELMTGNSYKELFRFVARQIKAFLDKYQSQFEAHRQEEVFDLGFTFSFPVDQVSINSGTLIRWTKGFTIPDAVGKDVCSMLQEALDELNLPVRVAALVNDTVGTLMARAYTSPGMAKTVIGAIFGTGTNGAYVEDLKRIHKLDADGRIDRSTGQMIVNAEWGSFDNHLSVLPNTKYDQALDKESNNPGVQMFEKRVSGMFLGEILRRALVDLTQDPEVQLFGQSVSAASPLFQVGGLDTSFLSAVEADVSSELLATRAALLKDLWVDHASLDDALAVKALVHAIGKRAARLSGMALSAILIESGHLEKLNADSNNILDIGVDGSLVEFYPGYVDYIREVMREVPQIGDKEKKIEIGIAKDGSGVGAALIALVARKENQNV